MQLQPTFLGEETCRSTPNKEQSHHSNNNPLDRVDKSRIPDLWELRHYLL